MPESSRTDINTLGEFGLIDHLTRDFPIRRNTTVKGIGDDAAVIDPKGQHIVVSTDMLIEGIHFDLAYTPLKHLGFKSVIVNLSDICAMNAIPEQITVSIALSNRFSVEALDELYAGIRAACESYNVDLVGGDTTSSLKGLIISITAIGRQTPDKIVYRNTAQPGDLVCITGHLGSAYLGLQLLEREKRIWMENPGVQPQLEEKGEMVGRFLKPEARLDMIQVFARAEFVPTSMIDISDGLASELFHICRQSHVGVLLDESGVSIHPEAQMQALEFGLDPITCALSGGEDYELLFTADPADLEKVRVMPDVFIAGEIVLEEQGLILRSKGGNLHPLKAQGWNHFSE